MFGHGDAAGTRRTLFAVRYTAIRTPMKSLFLKVLSCCVLACAAYPALAEDASAPSAPALAWSSYLGGAAMESAQAIAVAKDGTVWVAGSSSSVVDFPGPNVPFQDAIKGASDIFLARYRPEANGRATLLYWTWIGGTGDESVKAMALDSRGRVYLTGTTTSTDFPMAGNAFSMANAGSEDAFVAIVDPAQAGDYSLAFSSYYGGTAIDRPTALAIEPSGAFVVAGYTNSTDMTAMGSGVQPLNRGGWDAFVIRIDPAQSQSLTYASYLGSTSTDIATSVGVDKKNDIWLAGYTSSSDFPIAGDAMQSELRSSSDAFLAKIDMTKSGLDAFAYGSYFGGDGSDVPQKMIFDESGALWLAGYTLSTDFPTTANALQRSNRGNADIFVSKFDMTKPAAQMLQYSTLLGGGDGDIPYGFTLLGAGKFAVSGYTYSDNFPLAGSPIQTKRKSGFAEAFVATVDSAATGESALQFSTYFGGNYMDVATDVAADAAGNLYLSGYTTSSDLPVTDGSAKQTEPPFVTGFVTKISK